MGDSNSAKKDKTEPAKESTAPRRNGDSRHLGKGFDDAQLTGAVVGKYALGGVVGKGLSSEVRLAIDTEGGGLVALKIMEKEWIWRNEMSALIQREIDIMQKLDHPNVVKLIEVFNSKTHVYMALEAVNGRELFEEMTEHGKMDESRARKLFVQIMQAVQYIHSSGVAHRDIKLENLLLSNDGNRIKVTDFGLAARLDEWEGEQKQRGRSLGKRNNRRQQTACGTPSYAAPELFTAATQGYDARGVDVWCAGVVLYAMVTGSMPFQGEDTDTTMGMIRAKEPPYPRYLSAEIKDLLRGMLHKKPDERLSVSKVLAHPWTGGRKIVEGKSSWSWGLHEQQPKRPQRQQQRHQHRAPPIPSIPGHTTSYDSMLSKTPRALATAAQEAIEAARLAASTAERAAAEARAAEKTAKRALAAAAEAGAPPPEVSLDPLWSSRAGGADNESFPETSFERNAPVASVAERKRIRSASSAAGQPGSNRPPVIKKSPSWGRSKLPILFMRQSSLPDGDKTSDGDRSRSSSKGSVIVRSYSSGDQRPSCSKASDPGSEAAQFGEHQRALSSGHGRAAVGKHYIGAATADPSGLSQRDRGAIQHTAPRSRVADDASAAHELRQRRGAIGQSSSTSAADGRHSPRATLELHSVFATTSSSFMSSSSNAGVEVTHPSNGMKNEEGNAVNSEVKVELEDVAATVKNGEASTITEAAASLRAEEAIPEADTEEEAGKALETGDASSTVKVFSTSTTTSASVPSPSVKREIPPSLSEATTMALSPSLDAPGGSGGGADGDEVGIDGRKDELASSSASDDHPSPSPASSECPAAPTRAAEQSTDVAPDNEDSKHPSLSSSLRRQHSSVEGEQEPRESQVTTPVADGVKQDGERALADGISAEATDGPFAGDAGEDAERGNDGEEELDEERLGSRRVNTVFPASSLPDTNCSADAGPSPSPHLPSPRPNDKRTYSSKARSTAELAVASRLGYGSNDPGGTAVGKHGEEEIKEGSEEEDEEERRLPEHLFGFPHTPAHAAAARRRREMGDVPPESSPYLPSEHAPGKNERPTSPAGLMAAVEARSAASEVSFDEFDDDDYGGGGESHSPNGMLASDPRTPARRLGAAEERARNKRNGFPNTPDPHWLTDLVSTSRPLRELGAEENIWGEVEEATPPPPAESLSEEDELVDGGEEVVEEGQEKKKDEDMQEPLQQQGAIETVVSGEWALDLVVPGTAARAEATMINADGTTGQAYYEKGKSVVGTDKENGRKKRSNGEQRHSSYRPGGAGGDQAESDADGGRKWRPSSGRIVRKAVLETAAKHEVPEQRSESWRVRALQWRASLHGAGNAGQKKGKGLLGTVAPVDVHNEADYGLNAKKVGRPNSGMFAAASRNKDKARESKPRTVADRRGMEGESRTNHDTDMNIHNNPRNSGEARRKSGSFARISNSWIMAMGPPSPGRNSGQKKESTGWGHRAARDGDVVDEDKKPRKKGGGFRRRMSMAFLVGARSKNSS